MTLSLAYDPLFTTPGQVFAYWRTLPDMQEFVRQC